MTTEKPTSEGIAEMLSRLDLAATASACSFIRTRTTAS